MGLDIMYHSNMRLAEPGEGIDPQYPEEPDHDLGFFRVYVSDEFADVADDLVDNAVYHSEESNAFHAGSYSGYNNWREWLAEVAGYQKSPHPGVHRRNELSSAATVWSDPKPGPFVELINFSDCDGVIGPRTSAKLAKDFADFQEKADSYGNEYYREKYAEWRKAFETAAQGGCVIFC